MAEDTRPLRPHGRIRGRSLRDMHRRDVLLVTIPAFLILVAGLWFAARFIKPAPPTRVVMATGVAGGGYSEFGAKYAAVLARYGVTLELRPTEGAVENAKLLADPDSGVDIAFVQSGVMSPDEAPHLQSLGAVAYEPLWIFCRGHEQLDDISQLRGRRIAIGPPGSGTHELALSILKANGLDQESVQAVHATGIDGAEILLLGVVQCMFSIAPPEAGLVKALVYSPKLSLMNFARSEAYARRLQFLTPVTVPEGVFDLENDLPPRDIHMLAATAELVVRDTLHPAIQMLLLQAATEIHGGGGLFHRQGTFPANQRFDFPISPDAERYYKSGRPLLQRYLPFWLANLIDRMIVFLIPLVAVLFPLSRLLPPLYRWRVRSRIYRWYGELMFIENETRRSITAGEHRDFTDRLDAIERTVNDLHPPLAYADQLYLLRQHIDFVRAKLAGATVGLD
ncbi:MAG: C4-dicarboxylate ABC transporter substrate-binding protein [Betaproteobacteria bacterium]|nr:C4-dicarboxylate ABC transporter substrate-binding protein [Betaproteobacteria bacterium]